MPDDGKTAPKPPPRTVHERQQKQREEKLDQIKEQVDSGSLVIREMTKAERKRYPAQNRPPKRRSR